MTRKLSGIIHVRALDISNTENVRVMAQGGLTLAHCVNPDGSVDVGAAMCSFDDNFNRHLGKKIAVGRLFCESHEPVWRMHIESGVLEQVNGDRKLKISQGIEGEYFIRETDFALTNVLLETSKDLLVGISSLQGMDAHRDQVVIERVGNVYGFHMAGQELVNRIV